MKVELTRVTENCHYITFLKKYGEPIEERDHAIFSYGDLVAIKYAGCIYKTDRKLNAYEKNHINWFKYNTNKEVFESDEDLQDRFKAIVCNSIKGESTL